MRKRGARAAWAGCALALLAGLAPSGSLGAQLPVTYTLRLDNDAFDFWMAPYNRPDEEYSSGVHLMADGGDAPWWARRFLSDLPCTTKTTQCRTASFQFGQDIYSPATSVNDPSPAPGSRPNAGWLFVSQTARSLRLTTADALTFTVGVTGPPSLARQTQGLAHDLAPEFNRPTDWDRQIPFQPGFIAQFEHRVRAVVVERGSFGLDVVPRVAATLGNVTTDVQFGGEARVGWHLRHPWLPSDGPTEIALIVGATGRGVARDLFVDGHVPLDTARLVHAPFVARGDLGLEFRHRWLMLAYRAVDESRSYDRAPRWHPWASLIAGVTVDR